MTMTTPVAMFMSISMVYGYTDRYTDVLRWFWWARSGSVDKVQIIRCHKVRIIRARGKQKHIPKAVRGTSGRSTYIHIIS